jgi:hypothetical protein
MAAPGYVETNARVSIPSRLRPAPGGTLDVVLMPRPPLSAATLANANQSQSASVMWLDDDGTGHQEPLWLASAPPASEGVVEVDRYGGTFARARSTFNMDRGDHAFTFVLATVAGPGGEVLADTAELRGMGGVVWFDHNGTLGHVKGTDGNDIPVDTVAGMIDARTLMAGTVDATTDPAHPALDLSIPAAARRRATLGDLLPALGDYIVSMIEVTANEMDITGAVPVPDPEPVPVPVNVYASEAELNAILGREPSAHDERTVASLVAASRWVDYRIGVTITDDPITIPYTIAVVAASPAVHAATLVAAVRFYKGPDVPFGVAGQDLTAYVRTGIPDAELALLGQRQSFGIA